ncbi:MAG: sugar phosphate isomerase [Planctomycetota bacterium]|jgi:N-acetylmuramic acid 6-phosphate etherase
MSDAAEKAEKFLNEEKAFRLGELLTESFHPKTLELSQTARNNLGEGIRMLLSVDEEIAPAMEKVFAGNVFAELVDAFAEAMETGRRIYFTGCGATGRLSILLEAAWRRFWREHGEISAKMPEMEHRTISVMAGGDFALIKSVEGFEDFPDFGRYQLREAGVEQGDVVVAITEGGETPFVIGTAWEGLDARAEVFFVYNNPTDALRKYVQRSREVIDEPRIRNLDLTTGPMAITGSTRMQATTVELLVVGAALEIALIRFLKEHLSEPELKKLEFEPRTDGDHNRLFENLLTRLCRPAAVDAMARVVEFEEDIYRRKGLVTYVTHWAMLDVLTDTTERSPTFMLPPFRKNDDKLSPRSWAFVKDPSRTTSIAWHEMLQREPRGLDWSSEVYRQLNAPAELRANPPRLDNTEIYKFQIGNEPDTSRTDAPDTALVAIDVGGERVRFGDLESGFKKTAAMTIGRTCEHETDNVFEFTCDLPDSPLRLWGHLAVKLVLNTISTATMVRMDRVIGNAMVWLSPSNKKLIDRGSRLISQQTGCKYEQACIELHRAIEDVQSLQQKGQEPPSPPEKCVS